MTSLIRPRAGNGAIEQFGASRKIEDTLVANFEGRGQLAAQLLLATLTETPYKPQVGDSQLEVPVTNVFRLRREEEVGKDTVDTAKEALAEFVMAEVLGSRRIGLETYKTHYGRLLNGILPSRSTPLKLVNAFEESFVEAARSRELDIPTPGIGLSVIRRAPKTIKGLRLTGRVPRYIDDTIKDDMVTEDGHIIDVITLKHYTSLIGRKYSRFLSGEIRSRGGRAPGSTIATQIERRALELRTSHTER